MQGVLIHDNGEVLQLGELGPVVDNTADVFDDDGKNAEFAQKKKRKKKKERNNCNLVQARLRGRCGNNKGPSASMTPAVHEHTLQKFCQSSAGETQSPAPFNCLCCIRLLACQAVCLFDCLPGCAFIRQPGRLPVCISLSLPTYTATDAHTGSPEPWRIGRPLALPCADDSVYVSLDFRLELLVLLARPWGVGRGSNKVETTRLYKSSQNMGLDGAFAESLFTTWFSSCVS